IKYSLYISEMNKAMNDKFGIEDCANITYTSLYKTTELSFELREKVCDFMLNKFEKYEMTQEELDKERYALVGGFCLTFGDVNLSLFERIESNGKQYSIYRLGSSNSFYNYYVIESSEETSFNNIFRSISR
ncbi:MAG: hypothetical protein ACI4II_00590, partial [Acutalibacteraceae bacterium]